MKLDKNRHLEIILILLLVLFSSCTTDKTIPSRHVDDTFQFRIGRTTGSSSFTLVANINTYILNGYQTTGYCSSCIGMSEPFYKIRFALMGRDASDKDIFIDALIEDGYGGWAVPDQIALNIQIQNDIGFDLYKTNPDNTTFQVSVMPYEVMDADGITHYYMRISGASLRKINSDGSYADAYYYGFQCLTNFQFIRGYVY